MEHKLLSKKCTHTVNILKQGQLYNNYDSDM
jgi:hypothetical protein